MRKLFKSILVLLLAFTMVLTSLIVVAAETSGNSGEYDTTYITIGDGTRAYQLVWKFKSEFGHMYKRRWNATLGGWYDPDWILVY